jgi:hypothetical protein
MVFIGWSGGAILYLDVFSDLSDRVGFLWGTVLSCVGCVARSAVGIPRPMTHWKKTRPFGPALRSERSHVLSALQLCIFADRLEIKMFAAIR